jgi:hypothetical protein
MLDRIYHSKTCLQILEMEDEISLSKEKYLKESEWKTIPSLLELLKGTAEAIQTGSADAGGR